ncbi:MAG: hypothetical protein ACLP9C_04805 [Acidimicrobiales bacterium]
MTRTVLSALELPKAAVLTGVLVDRAPDTVDPAVVEAIGARLTRALGARRSGPGDDRLRVDGFMLRTAGGRGGNRPDGRGGEAPFAWSPRTARRRIGVGAVRACVRGDAANPAEAVSSVVDGLVGTGAAGVAPGGSLAAWLGSAGPGTLGITRAHAVTWATRLYSALEWARLGAGSSVGAPDEWWDCPGNPAVCLRGRCDVRVVGRPAGPGATADDAPVALLTMLGGRPGPTVRAELGLAALVGVLGQSGRRPPARVAGYWPDCGRALVLAVDDALLEHAATSVIEAVGALGAAGADASGAPVATTRPTRALERGAARAGLAA